MSIGFSGTSFEQIAAMIGHMAQAERGAATKEKGAEVKDAYDDKQAAKAAVKGMKAEIEHLKTSEAQAREDADWWDPTDDGEDDALVEAQIKTGIQVETTQKAVASEQEEIESIQRDVKDVHECYEASNSVVEDVRKEIEAATQAAITF